MSRERRLKSRSAETTRSAVRSTKSKKPVLCESMWEYIFVLLAEFNTEITEINHQPGPFQIWVKDRKRRYTPDFLVSKISGSRSYFEIKDQRELKKPKVVEKLEAAKAYFRSQNEELLVLSDLELTKNRTLISNIKHLKRYRTRKSARLKRRALEVNDLLPMTLGELINRVGAQECYALIANQFVWCDLTKDLTDESVVATNGGC